MEDNRRIVWQALEGSQSLFLSCPYREILFQGSRGGGKTDSILMAYGLKVGIGYGKFWRGVIFRRKYKELDDIVAKSQRWFPQLFPGAQFLRGKGDYKWVFPTGEELMFRHFSHVDDYWDYHGQEFPFIAWEELTSHPTIECYETMFSCNRTSYSPDKVDHPNPPKELVPQVRSTTNPYGVGHSWVKQYFIDAAKQGTPFHDPKKNRTRIHIASTMFENPHLNKEYIDDIKGLEDESKRQAWLYGSWDIIAGGMFSDVWSKEKHLVEPFEIPYTWRVDRSFDWGSARPFCTLWYAESDGSDYVDVDGNYHPTKRGDLFVIREDYGWNGSPNEGLRLTNKEIARRIREIEDNDPLFKDINVHPGPADSAIFTVENGSSIADDMAVMGVRWRRADKSPGSRVNGWQVVRQKLKNAMAKEREAAGLFFFNTCTHCQRLIPVTPRDDKKMDDIDTEFEDHLQDALRYKCRKRSGKAKIRRLR